MTYLLFRYFASNVYAFVAGILLSLAANLFTTARLAIDLLQDTSIVFGASLLLLISSGCFAMISWNLESARTEWVLEDQADPDLQHVLSHIADRKVKLWAFFTLGLVGVIYSAILLGTGKWWPING